MSHDRLLRIDRPARALSVLLLFGLSACVGTTQRRAGVLEFLYPEGKPAAPPADVQLELPVRVGVAFVPEHQISWQSSGMDEPLRQRLLQRVADAFRGEEGIAGIEIVPSVYLDPGGGFDNLVRLKGMFGLDLMALVSYEQTQIDEPNKASITYWTIVGAYVIPGEENDTQTFLDTSVFDIDSQAFLFHATGRSRVQGRSTPIDVARALREDSEESFELAVDDMITELRSALEVFREQAKTGTVRGPGTPALTVTQTEPGAVGAGAFGPVELGAALLLAAAAAVGRRRSRAA